MSHYSEKQYRPNDSFDAFYYSLLFTKGDHILDVACSTGNFVAQDKHNIIGIDIDQEAIKVARKRGLKAIRHDAKKNMPFKENSFQNVHCRHLLEHMDDPLTLMKDLHRVLKKGGRLVLLTDKMTPEFWDDYTHKRPFTKISLTQLAHDSGFKKFTIHDFPSSGVFGIGFLHSRGILSSSLARKLYLLYAIFCGNSLLLEAIK